LILLSDKNKIGRLFLLTNYVVRRIYLVFRQTLLTTRKNIVTKLSLQKQECINSFVKEKHNTI